MSNIINMPEAVEIAIYSLVLIAQKGSSEKTNVDNIAKRIDASANHLHKILKLLVKRGYITSSKGPRGGYTMKMDPSEISLLNVYEAVEGPLTESKCPLNRVRCPFNACIYDGLFTRIKKDFKNYFENKRISDFTGGKYGS